MNQYTPNQVIELMKVIHCMGIDEFFDMMDRDIDNDPGDYMKDKFNDMKHDIFRWLCSLDNVNQTHVFDCAAKKAEWYALKR